MRQIANLASQPPHTLDNLPHASFQESLDIRNIYRQGLFYVEKFVKSAARVIVRQPWIIEALPRKGRGVVELQGLSPMSGLDTSLSIQFLIRKAEQSVRSPQIRSR